jgi:hypothetical protein
MPASVPCTGHLQRAVVELDEPARRQVPCKGATSGTSSATSSVFTSRLSERHVALGRTPSIPSTRTVIVAQSAGSFSGGRGPVPLDGSAEASCAGRACFADSRTASRITPLGGVVPRRDARRRGRPRLIDLAQLEALGVLDQELGEQLDRRALAAAASCSARRASSTSAGAERVQACGRPRPPRRRRGASPTWTSRTDAERARERVIQLPLRLVAPGLAARASRRWRGGCDR